MNYNDEIPTYNSLTCPDCGADGQITPESKVTLDSKGKSVLPVTCKICSHHWQVELSPSFFSDLEFSSPNKVKLIPVEPAGEISPSPSFVPEIQFTKLEHGINKEAKVAVVPLPIFWITIASILLLVIVGVWLFWELQAQKYNASIEEAKQIALVEIAATGTAENRVTATQETITQNATHTAEARFIVAATSTVVQAATDIAATTTTEFKATSTAERIATANIEATHIASTAGTATAEKIATLNAHATQVTEQHATSTAESIATKAAAATSTVEWKATTTAEARSTPTPTQTPIPVPELNLMILGCDTGLDITRGLGEVKNAWVTVQNFGTANAHNVHIDLSANDEEASHPDKSVNIGILPPQNQITFKLTVDSGLGFGSEITATADSDETDPISVSKTQCRYLDANARELIANAGALGVTVAIQLLK